MVTFWVTSEAVGVVTSGVFVDVDYKAFSKSSVSPVRILDTASS